MKPKHKYLAISIVAFTLLVILWLHFTSRAAEAGPPGVPIIHPVAVAFVQRAPMARTLTLSGEFVPFQQVDVHAKVAGYIRKILVDVGDHVRTGESLAALEVPELNAQLNGADAAVQSSKEAIRRFSSDLDRSESLHTATHLDYARLKQASQERQGLIAEQELDDEFAKDKEAEGAVSSAQAALAQARSQLNEALAEQSRLRALSNYTQITAPFNGVITKRYVDTGSLVQAGTTSDTQALPVVNLAETDLFRLTLPVPESAVPSIHLGTRVTVHVQALNRDFEGIVARFADAVNQETRTMHTEIDVHNQDGSIVQGMYAEVALVLAKNNAALAVPIEAVHQEGSHWSALVVNAQDRIESREVQVGMESANQLEVVSGLAANERVVTGSMNGLHAGDLVAPKVMAEPAEEQP